MKNRLSLTRRNLFKRAMQSAFVSIIPGGAAFASTSNQNAGSAKPKSGDAPNVIFIMADDLGYADLSCFGRRDYKTPNLDALAESGAKLTHAYSNSPVCSATRTALMSGQYQYRIPVGLEEPLAVRKVGYPVDQMSLPRAFQEQGYHTALVGKWHLGSLPNYGPLKSGYDHFWGFRQGGVDYFTHDTFGKRPDLWDGEQGVEEIGYLTDLLGDKSIQQIESFAETDKPFFLSLHFSAPHWPWQSKDDMEESIRLAKSPNPMSIFHYDGGDLETYGEMVTRMDFQIGRVIEKLKELNIDDNTIIVFTSDNGGERFSDTWPFTGRKSELLEGGVRVPTIVSGPGISPKSELDSPVMTMDWMPTLLSMAGVEAPKDYQLDGVDVSGMFAGQTLPERDLFFRFNIHDQEALRRGRWKYLKIAGNEFLFDVIADPLERANLKGRHPKVFSDLKTAYADWNSGMLQYDKESFSGSFHGRTMADRFGISPKDAVKGSLIPGGPKK